MNELYIAEDRKVYLNGKEIQGILNISVKASCFTLELIGTCRVDCELSMTDAFEYLAYVDETKNEFTHIGFEKEDVNRNNNPTKVKAGSSPYIQPEVDKLLVTRILRKLARRKKTLPCLRNMECLTSNPYKRS